MFYHPGEFRWRPCWAWLPILHQSARAKRLDPNTLNQRLSLRLRRGRSGRKSFPLLHLLHLQRKVQKIMVKRTFLWYIYVIYHWHFIFNQYWFVDFSSLSLSGSNPSGLLNLRVLNTRHMKETFRSFVELLISVALDEDVMTALERANGEWRGFFIYLFLNMRFIVLQQWD